MKLTTKVIGSTALLFALLTGNVIAEAPDLDFAIHGNLKHRFRFYTNHADWFHKEQKGKLADGSVEDEFGEIKYRLWGEATTKDKSVKAVYAQEIGGLRFGESDTAPYSGDKVVTETRWAYLDFAIPGCKLDSRFRIGLQPFDVNPFLWKETVAGVQYYGGNDDFDFTLAWARGAEVNLQDSDEEDDRKDVDGLYARGNMNLNEDSKAGLFLLVQISEADPSATGEMGELTSQNWLVKKFGTDASLQLWTFGTDGKIEQNNLFAAWDMMFQVGSIDDVMFTDSASGLGASGDFDVSTFFGHLDLGATMGDTELVYTFFYTSGDNDSADDEFNGFLATDLDRKDSVVLMEGANTDDDYFTERHYLLDKGMIMNKIAVHQKATSQLSLGIAGMYMMTAEDIQYDAGSESSIGFEVNGYAKYKMTNNIKLTLVTGYLFSGDAIDFYEANQNGNADEDIFIVTGGVNYKF